MPRMLTATHPNTPALLARLGSCSCLPLWVVWHAAHTLAHSLPFTADSSLSKRRGVLCCLMTPAAAVLLPLRQLCPSMPAHVCSRFVSAPRHPSLLASFPYLHAPADVDTVHSLSAPARPAHCHWLLLLISRLVTATPAAATSFCAIARHTTFVSASTELAHAHVSQCVRCTDNFSAKRTQCGVVPLLGTACLKQL